MAELVFAGVSAVISGASLAGTSIEQISHQINTGRNITIQITNLTKKIILTNPRTHCYSGYNHLPPQPTILNNTKEVCAFSKTANAARGSVGVMTYQILRGEKECVGELAIMFSVPYDYNQYENEFGLGIFEPGVPCDDSLFNKMYNKDNPSFAKRGKGTGNVVEFSKKDVVLKGTMSASGQATLLAEIFDKAHPSA